MEFKEPEYVVYFTKKTSLILSDQTSDSATKNLITICQDFKDLVDKVAKYKESHIVKIYPVLSTNFDNIEDARNFHQQKIIANFDIEKLNATVSLIIKDIFDIEKDGDKTDKQKFCLAVRDVFLALHNSGVDIDEDKIAFKVEYKEDRTLIDVTATNLYTLLLQFGIPVKYEDVKDVKEFALPYGSFTIENGEPQFIPIQR